ncbi:hypothetical protein ACHQM5_000760 [Ranunculus cassubicifolius]
MSPNPPLPSSYITKIHGFFENVGISANLPAKSTQKDAYSDLIRTYLKVSHIEPGRITCILTVKSPITNVYGSLHGGALAAVAELVAIACVKSVVDNKDLFLGELATSYFSAALKNAEVEVKGFLVRQGRNLTVAAVEFRSKDTNKLIYTARATFYNLPLASL